MRHGTPTVALAHIRSAGLMGQHEYERQLTAGLQRTSSVRVRPIAIRPMRGSGGGRRVPMGIVPRLSVDVQTRLSSLVYGRVDLVHRTDARLPIARAEILTLHDLAPLHFNDEGEWPGHATEGARAARTVVVPSEFSAQEVRARLGVERVVVIPYGVDPACWSAGSLEARDRQDLPNLPSRYVLYAGGSSRRKNLGELAAAWPKARDRLEDDTELLICGPPSPEKTRLFAQLPACRIVGRLERAQLLRLMASASAVVVPSLYEGFGLPVLEGMAVGTVVVVANTSSLVEVASDIGLLAKPTASGLAAALVAALDGEHERRIEAGKTWARTFDWNITAERHADLYVSLLQRR